MPSNAKTGLPLWIFGLALGAFLATAVIGPTANPVVAGPMDYRPEVIRARPPSPAPPVGRRAPLQGLPSRPDFKIFEHPARGNTGTGARPDQTFESFIINSDLLDVGVLGPDQDFSPATVRRLLGIDRDSPGRLAHDPGAEGNWRATRGRDISVTEDRRGSKRQQFLSLIAEVEESPLRGAVASIINPSVDKKGYIHFSPFGLKNFDIFEQTTENGEPNFNARPWNRGSDTATILRDYEAGRPDGQSEQTSSDGYPLLFQLLRIAVTVLNVATSPTVIALAVIAGLLWGSYKSITVIRRFRRQNRFSVGQHERRPAAPPSPRGKSG